jgi:hypothetical protein
MEDLKARIKVLMYEIEYIHLKKNWLEQLVAAGIEQDDVYKWIAEIGHVIDGYERSLRNLVDLMEESDIETIAVELGTWIKITRDTTVWTIDEAMKRLEGRYEKYLPPEDDDEAESS